MSEAMNRCKQKKSQDFIMDGWSGDDARCFATDVEHEGGVEVEMPWDQDKSSFDACYVLDGVRIVIGAFNFLGPFVKITCSPAE